MSPVLVASAIYGIAILLGWYSCRAWKQSERWDRGFIKTAELWLRDRLWENPPPAMIEDRYRGVPA